MSSVVRFLLLPFLLMLAACIPSLRSPPTSSLQNITPRATTTPILLMTRTPTAAPATLTPAPTADSTYFRDDFDGRLEAGWSWIREEPLDWNLTASPGALLINVGGGTVLTGNISNILLRPAPAGDFQVETQLTFRPGDNLQFAGLILYQDDANFMQVGRSFCRAPGCLGEGLYVNVYRNGTAVAPSFGQTYKELDPLLLRVSRRGDNYVFEGSPDNKVWFIIGTHAIDLRPTQIGLIAGQNFEGPILSAEFEFFEVRLLP